MIPIQDKGEEKTFSEWVSLNENNRWLAGEGYESLTPLSKDVMDSAIKRYMEWLKSIRFPDFEVTVNSIVKAAAPIPQSSLKEEYWNGFRFACDLVDEMYSKNSTHEYLVGDCLLAKVKKLDTEKVRKNPHASSLTPKSISGVFVKYSERKPFVNGEYLCRFLTHLPVGLHGAEYLQYDKEEGGFMVEHNDYAKLEWFDESITDPKSIRDSEFKEWFFENCVINTGTLAEPVERSIDPYTMYVKLTSYFSKSASLKPNKLSDSAIEKMAKDSAYENNMLNGEFEVGFIAGCKAIIAKITG